MKQPRRNFTEANVSINHNKNKEMALERPVFINKNLENKESNFVALNTSGDVNAYFYPSFI